MRVGKSCSVEDVLEPGASGDAVGVEPVALELHHAVVQRRSLLRIELAGGEFAGERVVQLFSGGFEVVDFIEDRLQVELWISSFARLDSRGRLSPHDLLVGLRQLLYELADVAGVVGEVEGEEIGVGEAECRDPPELRHQCVIAVAGIAEAVHPEEVIVAGVINAVVSLEAEAEHRDTNEVQENSVVAAATYSSIGKAVVDDAG